MNELRTTAIFLDGVQFMEEETDYMQVYGKK